MVDAADQASWTPERAMYSNECDMFELEKMIGDLHLLYQRLKLP